jgi:phage regulator Rha-like protein
MQLKNFDFLNFINLDEEFEDEQGRLLHIFYITQSEFLLMLKKD